jgi:hypothetical protein
VANFSFITFDGLTLPTYEITHDSGTDRSIESQVELRAGTTMSWAARLPRSARIVQAHCEIIESSYTALQTAIDDCGPSEECAGSLVLGLVWASRTRTARLRQIVLQRYGGNHESAVDLVFQLYGDCWNGASNNDSIVCYGAGVRRDKQCGHEIVGDHHHGHCAHSASLREDREPGDGPRVQHHLHRHHRRRDGIVINTGRAA